MLTERKNSIVAHEVYQGRKAACWALWLSLFHSFPVIWFLLVAGGLAPAVLLFAVGLAGLFNTDSDSLSMTALILGPALIYGAIFWGVAQLLSRLLWRFCKKPAVRTSLLLIFLVGLVLLATQPVYVTGGHNSSDNYTLWQLVDTFKAHVPGWLLPGYLGSLAFFLAGLLAINAEA